jgi:hypothetical protein
MSPLPRILSLLAVWLLFAPVLPAAAPPRRDPHLEKLVQRLKTQPNDPTTLAARAKWRREHLNHAGALGDLEKLLAGKPSRRWTAQAQQLWAGCVQDWFAHDFAAAEKFFQANAHLWRDKLDCLNEGARTGHLPEYRQALAVYWVVTLRRREVEKKPQAAVEGLASLAGIDHAPGVLIPADGDPHRKLGFAVWARERYAELLARASAAQRKDLQAALEKRWRQAPAKKDIEALRGVVALLGVESALGREARLYLARCLAASASWPELERWLHELARGPDEVSAAKALLGLAEVMEHRGQLPDAIAYCRIVGQRYAKVQVGPGRKGADVLADLATDKRYLPFLEEPTQSYRGRFDLRYKEEKVSTPAFSGCVIPPLGEALLFVRRLRFRLDQKDRLTVRDSKTASDWFSVPLAPADFVKVTASENADHRLRYGHQSLGSLVFLNFGARVVCLDPLARKLLWERDVLGVGKGRPQARAVRCERDGQTLVDYTKGGSLRLAPMPLTPTRLCLATKVGLVALDPGTGAVHWSRGDVPQDCRLFDDGKHVFVVRFAHDGKVAGTAAYRLRDGAAVRIRDFSTLYEKHLQIVDGRLLLGETDNPKGPILHLYDAAAGKDVWRRPFAPGSHILQSEDPALTGAVEPKGDVFVLEARTKKEVMSGKLRDRKHLDKVKAIRLLGDHENIYLAIEQEYDKDVVIGQPRSLFQASAGLRAIPVNGMLYAFRRGTGARHWDNPAQNQTLLVSGFDQLPMILLAARYERRLKDGLLPPTGEKQSIIAFYKGNGKFAYVNDERSADNIQEVRGSADGSGVTMVGDRITVRLTAIPKK